MNVINRYYLLDSSETKEYKLERFKECDFNIIQTDKIPKYGSNIPLTLKEKTDPYLILFYYNRTDIQILKDWEQASGKTDFGEYLEDNGKSSDRQQLSLSEVSGSEITKFLEDNGTLKKSGGSNLITGREINSDNVIEFIDITNENYNKFKIFFNKREQIIKSGGLSLTKKEELYKEFDNLPLTQTEKEEYEDEETDKEIYIQEFEREFIQKYRNYNLLCNNDICKYIIGGILYFTVNKNDSETNNFRVEYKEYFPKSDSEDDLFFNFISPGNYGENEVIRTIYQLNSAIKVFEKLKEFFFRKYQINIEDNFTDGIKSLVSDEKDGIDKEIEITEDELNKLIDEKIKDAPTKRLKKNKFFGRPEKTIRSWVKEKYGYTNITTIDETNKKISYKNPKLIKLERTLQTLESRPITEDTVRNCLICLYKTYLVISEKLGRKLDPVLQPDVPDDYQVPEDWLPSNGKENWEWFYNTVKTGNDSGNAKKSRLYKQFKDLKERNKEEEEKKS